MATVKQVRFIESLMRSREIGDYAETVEAQTVRCGRGEELSTNHASRFIDSLLKCDEKTSAVVSNCGFVKGQAVSHVKFGEGIVLLVSGDEVTISFDCGTKKIAASFLK